MAFGNVLGQGVDLSDYPTREEVSQEIENSGLKKIVLGTQHIAHSFQQSNPTTPTYALQNFSTIEFEKNNFINLMFLTLEFMNIESILQTQQTALNCSLSLNPSNGSSQVISYLFRIQSVNAKNWEVPDITMFSNNGNINSDSIKYQSSNEIIYTKIFTFDLYNNLIFTLRYNINNNQLSFDGLNTSVLEASNINYPYTLNVDMDMVLNGYVI